MLLVSAGGRRRRQQPAANKPADKQLCTGAACVMTPPSVNSRAWSRTRSHQAQKDDIKALSGRVKLPAFKYLKANMLDSVLKAISPCVCISFLFVCLLGHPLSSSVTSKLAFPYCVLFA